MMTENQRVGSCVRERRGQLARRERGGGVEESATYIVVEVGDTTL